MSYPLTPSLTSKEKSKLSHLRLSAYSHHRAVSVREKPNGQGQNREGGYRI